MVWSAPPSLLASHAHFRRGIGRVVHLVVLLIFPSHTIGPHRSGSVAQIVQFSRKAKQRLYPQWRHRRLSALKIAANCGQTSTVSDGDFNGCNIWLRICKCKFSAPRSYNVQQLTLELCWLSYCWSKGWSTVRPPLPAHSINGHGLKMSLRPTCMHEKKEERTRPFTFCFFNV